MPLANRTHSTARHLPTGCRVSARKEAQQHESPRLEITEVDDFCLGGAVRGLQLWDIDHLAADAGSSYEASGREILELVSVRRISVPSVF